MGDVIHNLPIVADIHTAVSDAKIDWVVEEGYADLVRCHPGVSNVLPVAWRRWRKSLSSLDTWSEMRDFRYRLQKTTYDYVIDTQGLIKSAVIVKLTNAQTKCGFDASVARERWAAKAYDATFVIPKNAHAVERNRWLASAALEYYPDEHRLDYGLKLPEIPRLHSTPFVVCLPSTSRADKMWPQDHWITLGRWLNSQGLTVVMPTGTPLEAELTARLTLAIPSAIQLPKLSLSELAQWIQQSLLVVGVDTGLTHLGVALGRPTIGIYTGSSPELCGLYGLRQAVNIGKMGEVPSVETLKNEITRLMDRQF